MKNTRFLSKEKVDEKDFMILIFIVIGLVFVYFVYVNFIPKSPNISKGSSDELLKADVIVITTVDCEDCFDIDSAVAGLENKGILIGDKKVIDYRSDEGKKIIEKYGIERAPSFILVSKKINEMNLEGTFGVFDDYAVFDIAVPYVVIDSGEIKGLVNLKEIQPDCEDCLSLLPLKSQFEKVGIFVGNYEIVPANSSEGQGLIKENKLDFAPALLISKDISEYSWIFPQLEKVLLDKGDYYLFANPVPPYVDLIDNKVKGKVDITLLENKSCEDCFNVSMLKSSFQNMGVYIDNEKYVDVSTPEGKKLLTRYNITAIPTIILSKEILDYPQVRETLDSVGTFDEKDQSFIFRNLDVLNAKYQEIEL